MSQTIVPSQMAKMLFEGKKKAAQKGHDLLKRKADALKAQFMQVTKALIEQKKDLGNKFNQSLIFLAKANFAAVGGDVNRIVDENVKTRADVKLTLKTKPVAGVTLPQFGLRNMDEEKFGENTILGITGGGQTLNIAKKNFYEFLKKILEYIVIPKITYTINYIKTELDEREKEDKYKIKKVIKYKQKHKEEEEAQREIEKKLLLGDKEEEIKTTIKISYQKDQKENDDDEEIDAEDKLF